MVRAAQRTLPMGDVNAADLAQAAHLGALGCGSEGAAPLASLVSYRRPLPRGPTLTWVMVDDKIVTQVTALASSCNAGAPHLGDAVLLRRGDEAYARADLQPKESKRFRNKLRFNMLGAAVDGDVGVVSAKYEHRVAALRLSVALLEAQSYTLRGLESCAALWVQCLMFQRQLFSVPRVLFRAVHDFRATKPTHTARRHLGGALRDELLALTLLTPLIGTDITCPVRSYRGRGH